MDNRSLIPSFFGRGLRPVSGIFSDLQSEIERVFDDFTRRPFATNGREMFQPSFDVTETPEALELSAELPGCDPKDVDISLDGRMLTIRGEKKAESDKKEGSRHVVERSYGSFMRSMTLPFAIDSNKIEAKFDKGVLKLHLPKPPEAKAEVKKIAIKS
jgi:HSP20 family protein